jgi:endogenous inhibitor of DNA gyrase (YacG/DUF329 family)
MDGARLCVLCGKRPVEQQWRPFCSKRCRNEDLARWAEGRYRVPGEPVPSPDDQEQDHDQDRDQ